MTQVEFPISIGLVGAPGSGKKRLVDEFLKLADPWFEEQGSPLYAIGNAGTTIEREYDTAMGSFGGWIEDEFAYFVRYQEEQALRVDRKSYITQGTALENLAHCGVNMEAILQGVQTPESEQRFQQQQIAMTNLTFLFLSRFQYQFGFYLPYKDSIILPGEDNTESNYNSRIDKALQMIFGQFGLRIQVLDEGSFEEKAQIMFDTIKDIVENGPPPPAVTEEQVAEFEQARADGLNEAEAQEEVWPQESPPEEAATLAE